MESLIIYMPIAAALIGLLYMLVKKSWVMKQDAGDGKMKEISDYLINVPSNDTPRIQESHILVGHIICELVESNIFG